jgi:hypothetical protein
MKNLLAACLVTLAALPALADDAKAGAPAGGMDMSKMGPWSRKADEGKVKKEINTWLNKVDEAEKKGDMASSLAMMDFPVYMTSDSSDGKIDASEWSREKWEKEMAPFYENMPKDMKSTHKRNVTVLSDALAYITDDFTMTTGKQKMSGRNVVLIVKKGGDWKVKSMTEAGWAGMDNAAQGGSTGATTGSTATTGTTGATGTADAGTTAPATKK